MKLLFDATTGKPYHAVYENRWIEFTHTTNIPLTEMEVDEVSPDSKPYLKDLSTYWNQHRLDINGNPKYYAAWLYDEDLETETWQAVMRENWVEHQEVM